MTNTDTILDKQQEANSYLIAAAPALLEALKEMVVKFGYCDFVDGSCSENSNKKCEFSKALEKARAAIAKAEGK